MKNSWLFKLIGVFLLVIAVEGIVTSLLSSRATLSAFNLYTTRSGQIWAERITPDLVAYYEQNEGWKGVDVYLQETWLTQSGSMHQGMMGQGSGKGSGQGQSSSSSMMGALGQQLILTDQQGLVIYDSLGEYSNVELSASELKNGVDLIAGTQQVGTLLITPGSQTETNTLAAEFLASVRQAIIGSAVIAGIVALILGIILFFQITDPMRKLRRAATAVAEGDLTQRVDIKGSDEFAQLGETFNLMASNLSNAEIQRQHLMADVAHELRTPLTAIQGTVEGMQDGVLPCDADQLDALLAETTLLNRLIEDLRLLSLAETNQLKLILQPVDLKSLIAQIVDRILPQARTMGIELEQHLQEGMPLMQVDPDRITQIIINLINNAMRYTHKGGAIHVSTAQQKPGDPVTITVADTGAGINANDLPYVFDRFYRADKSRSRVSGGSGLGLAIVKELVEAHGGNVMIESPVYDEPNGSFGTRFTLHLPIK